MRFEVQSAYGSRQKRITWKFFFPEVWLGIEIDGAQHLEEGRKINQTKESVAKCKEISIVHVTDDE